MTVYYIDNRDLEIKCTVSSGEISITPLGPVFTDIDCSEVMSPVLPLDCNDTVQDNGDTDENCRVSVSTTSAPSWTFRFQVKDGNNWGSDTSDLDVNVSEGLVEWRIHASQASEDLYSDPFIRVRKGYSSEAPVAAG